jgi:hypothetical protein
MNRSEILAAAEQCISYDRQASYGSAEDSLGSIAALWSADLGIPITAVDVARLMVLMKMARAKANYAHTDSWVDAAGYAALAGEMATKTPGKTADADPEDWGANSGMSRVEPGQVLKPDRPKMFKEVTFDGFKA